ncbi:MAG: hypothetical protein IPP15_20380 [Saprospiraceae bacterium]|uniref:Uncharacterized protein n=1 Tax=Candidatus Opimibacter skivensis TaxID=2982028 RepID=A0A9D7XUD6_9BACT|nr:hypothetical protein [Candidatus Opimibacter skivensis]
MEKPTYMNRDLYKITLKEPCLILEGTGTELNVRSLDYIPGNIIRGIIASSLYDMSKPEQTISLFHNATILYHDANLIMDKKRSCKIPSIWQSYKGYTLSDNNKVFNPLLSDTVQEKEIKDNAIQLEAMSGYFILSDDKKNFYIKALRMVCLLSLDITENSEVQ